ncbi:hypothetical protein ACFU9F_17030 [Streptomyces zhihengii]|uniref:hypothetical protein n=1 Tax=Streptomyces zhihengii TaxID=1818004 RepID=UPI0036CDDB6F
MHLLMAAADAQDASGAKAAYQGVMAVALLLLALNVRDSAWKLYELIAHRGPFAPGPGFSPTVIRIVGAALGLMMAAMCVTDLN